MANLGAFNANEVDPNVVFDPIPAGKYIARIIESEVKPTKNGDGRYLELTFEVLDGEYRNRKVWDRLNLWNPSSEAVRIAQGMLSAICRAVGVMQPRDSVELHNLPLEVTVKLKRREDTGDLTNEVKGYGPKAAPAGQPQPAAQQQPRAAGPPPWKRG